MIVERKPRLWERYPLRCRLGFHRPTEVEMKVREGWGVFGGPLVWFNWRCARCRLRGTT